MRIKYFLLTILLLPLSLAAEESKTFPVGVMLCLSGACQEIGTNALRGIQMAQEKLNSAGGVLGKKVELVIQDTREMISPTSAVTAYRQLRLNPEIKFYIGPTWTIGGLPLAPIIAKDGDVIATSPTLGVETYNEAGVNIFNTWPHDSYSTKGLAKFALEHGWKNAAVLSNTGPWESTQAATFREEFKRLGGKEVSYTEINESETNLRATMTKIKASKPEMIFVSNYTQLDLVGRAISELHFSVPLMTTLLEETVVKNAKGTLDGIIYAAYEPAIPEFAQQYQAKYQVSAGMGTDTGYDTLMIYAQAIAEAGTFEVAKVIPKIHSIKYQGASGTVVFDSKGGVVKEPVFYQLKSTERVRLNG